MPRLFPPLRPKRPTNDDIPEPLRTPMAAPESPSNFAPELVCSPSMFVKTEEEEQPLHFAALTADVATQTVAQPSSPPSCTPTAAVADAPEPRNLESMEPGLINPGPSAWPSEVYNRTSTMWLLPPHSNQSSAIATLLQAEIQSHNITREMLHATEQRRLEAVQRSNQFASDARGWAAAHNNLTTALGKCAEEYSRVAADNITLRTQIQTFEDYQFDGSIAKDDQIRILRRSQSGQPNSTELTAPAASFGMQNKWSPGGDALYDEPFCDSECSECPYSPEV